MSADPRTDPPRPDPLTASDLAPARPGGRRMLTFDNRRTEAYESVFVQHQSGEWDRILIARDDGRIAQLLADLINAAALPSAPDHRPDDVQTFGAGQYELGREAGIREGILRERALSEATTNSEATLDVCPDCGLTATRIGEIHINAQVAVRLRGPA